MKIDSSVRKMTVTIAVGTLALTVLMVGCFILTGKFETGVLIGALVGAIAAILNFFLMGISVQKAAALMNGHSSTEEIDPAEEIELDEPKPLSPEAQKAKKNMQLSYSGRMLMMCAVGIISLCAPWMNAAATVIPMLFPRFIIFFLGLKQKEA